MYKTKIPEVKALSLCIRARGKKNPELSCSSHSFKKRKKKKNFPYFPTISHIFSFQKALKTSICVLLFSITISITWLFTLHEANKVTTEKPFCICKQFTGKHKQKTLHLKFYLILKQKKDISRKSPKQVKSSPPSPSSDPRKLGSFSISSSANMRTYNTFCLNEG